MDLTPFTIHYWYLNQWESAEIRPCCNEENVVDYAVWMNNQLAFTITKLKNNINGPGWIVALKNADKQIDEELVQILGNEIDHRVSSDQDKV